MTQPSPDVASYVDLRPFDRSDQEIFDAALALIALNAPEWVPREGHMEIVLLEGLALEASELIVALNRLPGAVLEAILKIVGVTKDYGVAPTALVNFYAADAAGHSVPAGTRLYVPTTDGKGVVTMLVEYPGLEIPAGSSQGTVSIIGDIFTSAANGMPAGSDLQLASPLAWVDRVTLVNAIADGADPESDVEWRNRGAGRLSRLSDSLVVASHFEAAALENAAVAKAVAVDNTDLTGGAGTGNSPGHISVAVLGDNGATLSTPAKAALQAALQASTFPALQVHVVDVTVATVTMTVSVHLLGSADPTSVVTALKQTLDAYLDPLAWTGGQTVRRNEIISIADRIVGVDYVANVTITGANGNGDLVFASPSTLPQGTLASITVTVV